MTYVERLEKWCKDNGVIDLKFFPLYMVVDGKRIPLFDDLEGKPEPTIEQLAEGAYKLLSGETPTRLIDVSEENL